MFVLLFYLMQQPGIFAVLFQQFGVGTPLDNLPVFQYQNHIGVSYGAEPVSNGNHGC
jgi:hypothetical protein